MTKAKVALLAALMALLVLPATSGAALQEETLMLDTHELGDDGAVGPVSTTTPLASGAYYIVSVDGTWSLYGRFAWNAPCFGVAEAAPMFPSPGVTNGKVGADAETIFAAVEGSNRCAEGKPLHWPRLEIDTGAGFGHVEPFGGPYSNPAPNHLYRYVVKGKNDAAAFGFQLVDAPSRDNYGQFRIRVRAPEGTGDLCFLTRSFLRESPKYASTSASQKVAADKIATELCSHLEAIVPSLKPQKKAALVNAYKVAVSALVPSKWLTAEQAAALRTLAGQI